MKVVINACYGGFGLSARAIQRLAELQGRPCYFFKHDLSMNTYTPLPTLEEASSDEVFCLFAYDIPNPNEVFHKEVEWHEMSLEERQASNDQQEQHTIQDRDIARNDPLLVQVVEELGEDANTRFSNLKVVEIPDDVAWEIDEYDGYEHVAETHRTWP